MMDVIDAQLHLSLAPDADTIMATMDAMGVQGVVFDELWGRNAKDQGTPCVEFADGVQGEVRFLPSHLTGVFKPLLDPDFFAQVSVRDGAVTWPGDLDLAPDAMYDAVKQLGVWVLQ